MFNQEGVKKENEIDDNFVSLEDYEPLQYVEKITHVRTAQTNASTKASEDDKLL